MQGGKPRKVWKMMDEAAVEREQLYATSVVVHSTHSPPHLPFILPIQFLLQHEAEFMKV